MIKDQAVMMLTLQNRLNAIVNPQWLSANYPFLRAAFIEAAEALEHHGWKWWKKQESDLGQVQIELIDILHFYFSDLLIEYAGNIDSAADILLSEIISPGDDITFDGKKYILQELSIAESLELIGALSACRRRSFPVLHVVMGKCEMSWSSTIEQYISKNVLNIFRQDHGYKNGSYIKIWEGEEDNVVLLKILKNLNTSSLNFSDDLYNALEEYYARISHTAS